MNQKGQLAWELYLKMGTSSDSFSLLQLIANDCYKVTSSYNFFYILQWHFFTVNRAQTSVTTDLFKTLNTNENYVTQCLNSTLIFFRVNNKIVLCHLYVKRLDKNTKGKTFHYTGCNTGFSKLVFWIDSNFFTGLHTTYTVWSINVILSLICFYRWASFFMQPKLLMHLKSWTLNLITGTAREGPVWVFSSSSWQTRNLSTSVY